MRNRTKVLLTYLALGAVVATYTLLPPKTPLNPRGNIQEKSNAPERQFIILGFLPYWNYAKLSSVAQETVTHLAYFSLQLQGDGTIQTKTSPLSEEPGYTTYKKLLKNPPEAPLILVFAQANNEEIETLLTSSDRRRTAVRTITETSRTLGAAGVNIDLEPSGGVPPSLRDNFTQFIQELRSSTCPSSTANCPLISIDIYPTAASRQRLWDLEALEPYVDHVIVMTYDYHQQGSKVAGPNAPLRGTPLSYDEDILKNVSELTAKIPPRKILLGIPFYGYEWATQTAEKYARAEGGAVASLERIRKLTQDEGIQIQWDRNSLTPYIVIEEEGTIKQIYFDNNESIALKLDLVRQANLGGIAIWALGYEGDNTPIWESIKLLR